MMKTASIQCGFPLCDHKSRDSNSLNFRVMGLVVGMLLLICGCLIRGGVIEGVPMSVSYGMLGSGVLTVAISSCLKCSSEDALHIQMASHSLKEGTLGSALSAFDTVQKIKTDTKTKETLFSQILDAFLNHHLHVNDLLDYIGKMEISTQVKDALYAKVADRCLKQRWIHLAVKVIKEIKQNMSAKEALCNEVLEKWNGSLKLVDVLELIEKTGFNFTTKGQMLTKVATQYLAQSLVKDLISRKMQNYITSGSF